MLAQDANAETMKRGDQRRAAQSCVTEQSSDALAHLLSRFVGKRDGEDVVWRDIALRDEISDPIRNNARLA